MRSKTCCFTGHRVILPNDYGKIKKELYNTIVNLIEKGVIYFGCGGALGFDTLAAETIIELKKRYKEIKLIMVYPCKNQTLYWNKNDINRYIEIKNKCDKYVYVSETYDNKCMFKRNKHLVDNSNYCICYKTKSNGGTAYTVDYAISKGLTVINIAQKIKG